MLPIQNVFRNGSLLTPRVVRIRTFNQKGRMQIKAVVFDIDGTLVDSNDMHVLAWEEAFASIGKSFGRQDVHDQIGRGSDMLVPMLLPELDKAAQENLGAKHGLIFKEKYLASARLFLRAHDLLAHAYRQGQHVVLASSASASELDHYLGLLDARDLVSATTSGDEVKSTKPAPDIFALALDKLGGIHANEVIVVGTLQTTSRLRRSAELPPSACALADFRTDVARCWCVRDLRRCSRFARPIRRLRARSLNRCRSRLRWTRFGSCID